jgi:hypothetical protein
MTSGRPAAAHAAIAVATPFSGARRDTTSACSPAAADERATTSRTTWPTTWTGVPSSGAPSDRSRVSA